MMVVKTIRAHSVVVISHAMRMGKSTILGCWFPCLIVDGVDVKAALEDLFDESKRKQRRTKACGRTT